MGKIRLECQLCKERYYLFPSKVKKSRFCSRKCSDKSKIGIPTWNKGKKIPEELRPRFKKSEELRKRISKTLKRKYKSGEIMHPRGTFGIKRTEEQNKKTSDSMKLGYKEGRIKSPSKGKTPWNKDKKISEETRKKMIPIWKENAIRGHFQDLKKVSEGLKRYYKENPERLIRQRKLLKELRKNTIIPKKDTSIEVKIQNFLTELHLEFYAHKYLDIKHGYQCDVYIPKQETEGVIITKKTIIECDGCYFHNCPICKPKIREYTLKQVERDKIRTKELQEKGYKVIRLWEHEIKKMNPKKFLEVFR